MKIVDTPNIEVTDMESLKQFYRVLGAKPNKKVNALKVHMNTLDLNNLHDGLIGICNDNFTLLDLALITPDVDDNLPVGKVKLINGWLRG